jgi:transcription initiation factor IIF auxiliary subunit
MTVKFDNFAKETATEEDGAHWFRWKVFVDESGEVLERIRSVEYRLHETFPDPIQLVTDRESRFALEGEGWGEFRIFITVAFVDGEKVDTTYALDLSKSWPPDEEDPPSIEFEPDF